MPCAVCCESFNKSNRARITCPYCPFSACSTCHERYLCDTSEDAHCMNCRKGWTRETLFDNFTQKFVSRVYKSRRENLLMEREKSLMPATQPYVEIEKEIRRLALLIIEKKSEVDRAHEMYSFISNKPLDNTIFQSMIIRHENATRQAKVYDSHRRDLEHLEWHTRALQNRLAGGTLETEKRQFVRACPYADCKGFLSTAWKCGLCENWSCPECHEVKGPEKDTPHVCDPNNVATAQLLARDSRNCPKCAASIFKIDGCDQMWCTQCHAAFSWRTGRIETHTIHNPHYYDFMRTHGGGLPRNPGDVPCGGFPHLNTIRPIFERALNPQYRYVENAHRMYGHTLWIIQRYQDNGHEDNRDLRIKLMIGDINADVFKTKIQQREKARHRKTEIRQVIEMFRAVLVDLFQTFITSKNIPELTDSLARLGEHYNSTLDAISKRYGHCSVPKLNDAFHIY
jgi:hypothetical protein